MRSFLKALVGTGLLLAAGCGNTETGETAENDNTDPQTAAVAEVNGLKTPVAFAAMNDDKVRAAALFDEMAKVILHPRCANCHPRSGGPTQGDAMDPHNPPVVRGDGVGAVGMQCATCHGPENVEFASMKGSVPGAEPWLLAPVSMGWSGTTAAEVCGQIKNTELNGNRTLEDLVEHMGRDHLVNWAWHPGEGRSPAPGDQETMGALAAAWVDAGAHCPET